MLTSFNIRSWGKRMRERVNVVALNLKFNLKEKSNVYTFTFRQHA